MNPGSNQIYDAIVVGSGAAGGFAARRLTKSGLKTLVLEAGPLLDTATDFRSPEPHDRPGEVKERLYALLTGQPVQCRSYSYKAFLRHFYVNDKDHQYSTARGKPFVWVRGRQVGGRLHTWGRHSPRFSDLEFKAGSHDDASEDWPLSYSDLAPHYDVVERCMGRKHHKNGSPQPGQAGCVSRSSFTAEEERFRAAIENRWPDRRVRPVRLLDQHTHPMPPALMDAEATGLLTLRPDSVVRRILTDPQSGKATGVEYADRKGKDIHSVAGRMVFLCASAFESVRLLLNSKGGRHPLGIGGSSGILGRYVLDHLFRLTHGTLPADREATMGEPTNPFDFSAGLGFYIPRFQNLDRREPNFLRGYGISGGSGRGGHHWWMAMFGEALPRSRNRIRLNHSRKDSWGIPSLHIDFEYGSNDHALFADAQCRMEEMRREAQMRYPVLPIQQRLEELFIRRSLTRRTRPLPGLSIHELGGARMGVDSASSVLDPFCRCWDAQNVIVSDGACFVTAGYQNPALTIMALSDRAAELAVAQYDSIAY